MKLILIRSRKPGLYRRRQVIYQGEWVSIRGFAFLRTRHKHRKWTGWAAITPIDPPNPLPASYKKHSERLKEPYTINHYPEGKE